MWKLIVIATGLAMDAFAAAVCKGLSVQRITLRHALITGLYFGGSQALMPLFGYLLGETFKNVIERIDHWIAFFLLVLIGVNMILESLHGEEKMDSSFGVRVMLPLALSVSIDALAAGVTFAIEDAEIYLAVLLIGVITAAISMAGLLLGNLFGAKYKAPAEIFGGAVLIFMGAKLLFEHLGS